MDLQSPSLAASPLPPRGLASDDAEYDNLIGAMDNDLDRPEPLRGETLQEPSSHLVQNKGRHACLSQDTPSVVADRSCSYLLVSLAVLESKGKLRGKAKAQRKKEEKEKKSAAKTQGDELKENLADNDDSSSTTTETSNPDVETSIKEVA